MVDAWLVGLCSILGYYMTTSHSTHTQHNNSTQHIKWLAEFMQCLSCSCLALCLESWSQGEGTEGLFLGLSSSCSTRGGAIYSKVSSSHQIQRFPPCSSLCEMVTGVASGQIVYMHALVGGPCKQELDSFFGSPVPPSKPLKAASADFSLSCTFWSSSSHLSRHTVEFFFLQHGTLSI